MWSWDLLSLWKFVFFLLCLVYGLALSLTMRDTMQ
jgi:hypothetical protein